MHFCSPSFTQCTGAGFESRPGGENVVHHHDGFAGEASRRLDRPANIAPPFRSGKSGLALPALDPGERAGFPRLAVGAGQRLGEPSGLVEAADGETRPVHGCGRKEIGAGDGFAGGSADPTGKDRQPIAPAAAFQIEDQPASVVVVGQSGAGAVIGWLPPSAGAADGFGANIVGERKPAAGANGLGDELKLIPERRLDDAWAVHEGVG